MAIWGKNRAQFRVIHPYGVGAVKFSLTEEIDKIDEAFRAIGTRSSDGPGTCVVYIDDVYVYIKGHRH